MYLLFFLFFTFLRIASNMKSVLSWDFWKPISSSLKLDSWVSVPSLIEALWGFLLCPLLLFQLAVTFKILIVNAFSFDAFIAWTSLGALFLLIYDTLKHVHGQLDSS